MSANVVELVLVHAIECPDRPAIITSDRVLTYRQLGVAVGVVATHLKQNKVEPGQVVGVSMGQNALHLVVILALAQIGAVSLPLHMAVPMERRMLAARRFGVSTVVSGRAEMKLDGLPFISLAGVSFDGMATPPAEAIYAADVNEPFRIALSSGTSGDPKGMVLTHGAMALRVDTPDAGFTDRSRTMAMDLNFIVGFRPAMTALAKGTAVVMPASMRPDQMLQAMVSHAVTHVYLSPDQARGMVTELATEGVRCPDLVCLRIGGGPLPVEMLREVQAKISPKVYVSYGSTESGLVTYATPEILQRQPGSVGRVCSWAKVEVVGDDGKRLAADNIGRLRIRSEHQVGGYYRDDARNQKHFRDGWFYPGDLGGFDEEGLLYIEGRVDDQLNVGGLKINPEDIDQVLAAHPSVLEAGAFVLANSEGRESLASALVLRDVAHAEAVRQHAQHKLGPLAPKQYFIVASLPRTITGKLRRAELTAQFSKYEDDALS